MKNKQDKLTEKEMEGAKSLFFKANNWQLYELGEALAKEIKLSNLAMKEGYE